MPVYCFTCSQCGDCSEEHRPMRDSQNPKTCRCGQGMNRDLAAEHRGVRHHPGNWPMESDAAGGHPDDVPQKRKIDALHGVPTEYSPDGNPIFTGPQHRRAYCRVHGLYDRNAGYADPTPHNR